METQAPLTNAERRDDVLFLLERFEAGEHRPPELLDDDEKRRFLGGDTHTQRRLFYRLLCYGALAAQPAPEALVRADWQRLRAAGLPDDIFDRRFDIERFAAAAPVARTDSKGRIIDFVRLSETRDDMGAPAALAGRPGDASSTCCTPAPGGPSSRAPSGSSAKCSAAASGSPPASTATPASPTDGCASAPPASGSST